MNDHNLNLTDEQLLRYSRHLLLDQFGLEGQQKLNHSRVAIIGCGGLGHPVSLYLAASGIGQLHLYDHDHIEISNLQRQIAFKTQDIGQPKSSILARSLLELNPGLDIRSHHEQLVHSTIPKLSEPSKPSDSLEYLKNCSLIIDCSDNFATRFYLNTLSLEMKVPLLMGAAIEYQGLAALFNTSPNAPCYACLFDENDEANAAVTCSNAGVYAPLLGIVGSTMSHLALQFLQGHPLLPKLYSWDLRRDKTRHSLIEKNQSCPVCLS